MFTLIWISLGFGGLCTGFKELEMNCPIKLDVLFSCSICAAVDDQIQFSVSSFAPGLDLALIDTTNLQCKYGRFLMWTLCQQQCAYRSKVLASDPF